MRAITLPHAIQLLSHIAECFLLGATDHLDNQNAYSRKIITTPENRGKEVNFILVF